MLYDSMTFWKRQNYGERERVKGQWLSEVEEEGSNE